MNQLIQVNSNIVLQKPVEYITLEEAEAIKRACDIVFERSKQYENDRWLRDRDKLLFSLLWITGGRITDVLNMSIDNINFKENTIMFLVRKRKNKARADKEFWHNIMVDMATLSEIMDYIQTWSMKGFLFPNHRATGIPLTRQAISKKINTLSQIIGMKHIHCHMYRHGLAMHLQAQGVPIETIAFRLAHSSTSITLRTYARMDASQEKKMYDNLGIKLR